MIHVRDARSTAQLAHALCERLGIAKPALRDHASTSVYETRIDGILISAWDALAAAAGAWDDDGDEPARGLAGATTTIDVTLRDGDRADAAGPIIRALNGCDVDAVSIVVADSVVAVFERGVATRIDAAYSWLR
jgi:hypothetical protein